MERSWRRRTPWREVSREEAEALVRLALPGAGLVAMEPLRGGLRNVNYRLKLARGSSLVLRFYTTDPTAGARETAVLGRVRSLAPVPEVAHSAPDADPPWALLRWMEGTPMDEVLAGAGTETALSMAEAAGTVLAAIHSVRFPSTGFLDGSVGLDGALGVGLPLGRWRDVLAPADWMESRLGTELAAGLHAFVERHADEGDGLMAGSAALCQGDFKPSNLLVSASGKPSLAGVLDWEFAFAGNPLFDIATFLRDRRLPELFADAFADGYANAGGVLPPDWRRQARLLDLVNVCQLAEWGDERQLADLAPLVGETLDLD